MASASQLIAMGKMSVGEAETQFKQNLAISIPSSPVRTAIVTECKKIITTSAEIKKLITDAVAVAAQAAGWVKK